LVLLVNHLVGAFTLLKQLPRLLFPQLSKRKCIHYLAG